MLPCEPVGQHRTRCEGPEEPAWEPPDWIPEAETSAGRLCLMPAQPGLLERGGGGLGGPSAECRKLFSWRGSSLLTEGILPSGLHQCVWGGGVGWGGSVCVWGGCS